MAESHVIVSRTAAAMAHLTWDQIVEAVGDLNVGLGDSRNAGNCDGGTDAFARVIREEWWYKYGEACKRKYAPIRTVVALYLEARAGYRVRDRNTYLRWAIAHAVVRNHRQSDIIRVVR